MSQSTAESLIDLYPSEILAIEKVMLKINQSQGTARNVEGFVRETEERFAHIGLVCEVVAFEDEHEPGFFAFNFVFRGRVDPVDIDHDQMRHEVQHDVTGLSHPGAMTSGGAWIEPSTSTSMSTE